MFDLFPKQKNFFEPGRPVGTFTTKKGQEATVRYPAWSDLGAITDWINRLSYEDTYIRFSGETVGYEQEARYLGTKFAQFELQESVQLLCFVEGRLAAKCDVDKQPNMRRRYNHIAIFGLSVDKDFRGQGIGFQLAQITIAEAKNNLPGLKLLKLECMSNNTVGLALYQKIGFQECGRIPNMILYKGQYVDEVQMAMPV